MRSLLAFWLGGAAAPPVATQAGVRSLLAPWIGGAGAADVEHAAGVRSMLAFWMGGGASSISTEPLPETPIRRQGGGVSRMDERLLRLDDEIVLLMAAAFIASNA